MRAVFSIKGSVKPGFEAVEWAFRENFERRGEVGAAACAWVGGERVVDLWGGLADREREIEWDADTLVVTFSCTKGMVAVCLLLLADRGHLDLDRPVAAYWPEFAAGGKQEITVRELLNHRSGLAAVDAPLGLPGWADPERVGPLLANQQPLWEPGSAQGYGAVTGGAYAAELVRRIDGRSAGRFFAEEVAGPLAADVYVGLPEALEPRVATLYRSRAGRDGLRMLSEAVTGRTVEGRLVRSLLHPGSPTRRAFGNPRMGRDIAAAFNDPSVHALELPWAGGIASARGLARVYADLASDDPALCRRETVEPLKRRQSWSERDRVMRKPLGFSQGFLKEERHVFSPGEEAFGHSGMGGALGLADPDRKLAFAYVMNRMDVRVRSPRCLALCHALYGCL